MPSKRIYSPGTPPVSSAGSAPPESTGVIDPWKTLPTREETERLLAEHLPSQEETKRLLRELTAPDTELDERYLVADLPPLEEHPE